MAVEHDRLDVHRGRSLSPLQVAAAADADAVRSTTYRTDSLLVPVGPAGDAVREVLEEVAREHGLELTVEPRHEALVAALGEDADLVVATPIRLVDADGVSEPPDAWSLARRTRSGCRSRRSASSPKALQEVVDVHLDHLMLGTDPDVAGLGAGSSRIRGNGVHFEGHAVGGTGVHFEGHGGGTARIPVTWVGDRPPRADLSSGRRPVVAVLDTGCTPDHPWLNDVVDTDVRLDDVAAGLTDPATDPEVTGDVSGPWDGLLDSHSGHGTFIAGLLLQGCPDVDVLAVRVMSGDGVVVESDLLHALTVVAALVSRYRAGRPDGRPVDAVVLSLGYHHERPADALLDVPLRTVLDRLRSMGVAVVASAGNGATDRPLLPAGFAPHDGSPFADDESMAPMVSVGATNPDASTSLFSNTGPWVTDWQPGASLVSTMPPSFAGGFQPSISYTDPDGWVRATLDPDDFTTGFGVWSGTSFAGPVLAGALLQGIWEDERMASGGGGLPDDPDADDALTAARRARRALRAVRESSPTRRRGSR